MAAKDVSIVAWFAGSSRTIIGGNKSIGMSESPATI